MRGRIVPEYFVQKRGKTLICPHNRAASRRRLALIPIGLLCLGIALLAGCGGGGGGGGGGTVVTGSTVTLTGTVTDFGSGNTVSGATVLLQGTGNSVTTNGSGVYSLPNVPANSNVTLVVTDPAYPTNVDHQAVTTGNTTPETENIDYPFSLLPPSG